MNKVFEEMSNPYAHKKLERDEAKGKEIWLPGKKFAEKMILMKEGLEDCYKKGELTRESGLGKLIQEAEDILKPGTKIENLSLEEVEKLQEKVRGLAIYAPEAVKIAAEILDQKKLH